MRKLLDSVQENLLLRFADNQLNELEMEQVRALLKRFVNGELDTIESERVLSILGESEHCLDMLDEIWAEQPIGRALAESEILDKDRSKRIESRIVQQIHLSDTLATTVKLGTTGFGAVASGLLRPLITRNKWRESSRQRRRRRKNK